MAMFEKKGFGSGSSSGGGRKKKFDKKKQERRPRRILAKPVLPKDVKIDYKNLELLHHVVAPNGRIMSQRFTGANSKQQRAITQAVKRATFLALVPVGSSRKRF
ncbi:MAG: 30S ribosomal protein S18 [Candidatus Omnitrophica bacterium]|nr:30S ribosomal protein S18 [Candidatus Omnitrophota bacterium]